MFGRNSDDIDNLIVDDTVIWQEEVSEQRYVHLNLVEPLQQHLSALDAAIKGLSAKLVILIVAQEPELIKLREETATSLHALITERDATAQQLIEWNNPVPRSTYAKQTLPDGFVFQKFKTFAPAVLPSSESENTVTNAQPSSSGTFTFGMRSTTQR